MEFILLIIVVVIISAISAAAKKKPKSSEGQDAPPPTMSDIQRAFMMTANVPEKRPAPYPPPIPPQAAPYMALTQGSADTDVPSEGRTFSEAAAPTVAESYTGLSEEVLVKPMAIEPVVPLAGIRPDVYFAGDEKPVASVSRSPAPKAAARIPLLNDQREIVRAFIYAEILPRRAYPPRFR